MTHPHRSAACLLGALVADAAALGLHWLYDVERIAQITQARGGSGAFVPLDPENYAGAKGVFVHGARGDGMTSQYGAALALALGTMREDGVFDPARYRTAYAEYFGAGGAFTGYIDRPTRGTLANIAAEQIDPSGVDDDQLPALATLPAVVVAHGGTPDLDAAVQAAIRVTNVNPVAEADGAIFARLLADVLAGSDLAPALLKVAESAPDAHRDALMHALTTDEDDSTVYGEHSGRACHLPMAMPLIFHILARSDSFAEASERNIAAGGDSCGRAIAIGAVMGALHETDKDRGIPLNWILALQDGAAIWADCRRIAPA